MSPTRYRCLVQTDNLGEVELFVYATSERKARVVLKATKLKVGVVEVQEPKIVSVDPDTSVWAGRVLIDVAPARETRR